MVKCSDEVLDLIFHALSDPIRRSILLDVSEGPRAVGDVASKFDVSLPAVSRHIKVLEEASLVRRERRGSFQMVHLSAGGLQTAEAWISYYSRFWNTQIDKMQQLLEQNHQERENE